MKKTERKPLSMFSKETLDSLEMAEILGGTDNNKCSNLCNNNDKCADTECSNTPCSNTSCINGIPEDKRKTSTTDKGDIYNIDCINRENEEKEPIKEMPTIIINNK